MIGVVNHIPVLLNETINYLNPKRGDIYIDGTIGYGGHAIEIIKRILPGGKLIGIDRDVDVIEIAKKKLSIYGDAVKVIHGDFGDMMAIVSELGIAVVNGILLDLGVSSLQLGSKGRGFSFDDDISLDMRMDRRSKITAYDLVNNLPEKELASILWRFGEERQYRRIAKAIVESRRKKPITTAKMLSEMVSGVYRGRGRLHPATRMFQALRIAVNDELGSLQRGLKDGISLLKSGGRFCVISFHSLEDRIVKDVFRESKHLKVLTKRPIVPTKEEIDRNPRSRSAKLRVAE
ncbi:MAG: 16S rRNA (cytosine(1402)-N(4))-methyltransferase RsmH, partial [Nitrospirota bacterium]